MINSKTQISKDIPGKKIQVTREFAAPVEKVWKAWTDASLLDKWWAPKPWKAETKEMNFTEGGRWLYSMLGPEGEANGQRHWSRLDFKTIDEKRSFTADNGFCDENGVISAGATTSHWNNKFAASPVGTKVTVELAFDKQEDLETLVNMGFEGGFSMGMDNLDELLATQQPVG